jgi:hypothetical protein
MSMSLVPAGAETYLPALTAEQASERRKALVHFVNSQLTEGQDYMTLPGTKVPTLLQPGADKLANFFGLEMILTERQAIRDWTGEEHGGEPFFYFEYSVKALRNGVVLGESIGSANSREKKYRWRWVDAVDLPKGTDISQLESRAEGEFVFGWQLKRAETTGKYGKPQAYWDHINAEIAAGRAKQETRSTAKGDSTGWSLETKRYRIPNPEICDMVNTLSKMAQKRAYVGSVIRGVGASEFYTQDIEDNPEAFGIAAPAPAAKLVLTEEQRYALTTELDELIPKMGPKAQEAARAAQVGAKDDDELSRVLNRVKKTLGDLASKSREVQQDDSGSAQE